MQVEAVQRRAARFALNCYDRYNTSVTELIKQLGWDSLENRRTVNRLNIFYKIINNQIAIHLPNDLQQPVKKTKNITLGHIQMSTGPNYYINSFFPRTVRDWNSLQENIIQAPSADKFRTLTLDFLRMNRMN